MQTLERPPLSGLEIDPGAPGRAALEAADRAQAAIEELLSLIGYVQDREDQILALDRLQDLKTLVYTAVDCVGCCQGVCMPPNGPPPGQTYHQCYTNCDNACLQGYPPCGGQSSPTRG